MKKMYCMECGKQGCFFGYTYPVVFILLGIVIAIFTYVICGEKAEAKRDIFLKVDEPNDLKIDIKSHYTAEELDEIYKDEPALGKLAKSLWGVSVEEDTFSMQPQEKNFKAQFKEFFPDIEWEPNDMDEWWSNSITAFGLMLVEKRLERIEKSLIESEPNEPETTVWDRINPNSDIILFAEPNEPECEGHGVTAIYCPECHGELESLISGLNEPETVRDWVIDIGSFIPTWPDYIELEKDLIVDMSHKNDPNYPVSYYPNWLITKGTKIYFKE